MRTLELSFDGIYQMLVQHSEGQPIEQQTNATKNEEWNSQRC